MAFLRTSRGARGQRPSGPAVLNRASPHAQRLVSWVPFDSRGAYDVMRSTSASPVNGQANIPGSEGLVGQFVSSSDQYVSLGNPTPLQITGPITVSCRYQINTVATGNMLVTKDKDTGGRAFTFDVLDGAGSGSDGVRFYINGGSGGGSTVNIAYENRRPVSGDRRLVTAVYTGATTGGLQVFIDGRHVGSDSTTTDASMPTATANVLIGRREYAGFEQPFDGLIWDVRVYNRALSPAEIWSLYEPSTRWDLYAVPSTRVYFDQGAAAAAFLARRPLSVNQAVNRSATF